MKRVHLNKIGSVTSRLQLRPQAVLGDVIPAQAGTVVAARVLNSRRTYNTLENPQGRLVPLRCGDVLAGALGHRHALHGFAGNLPTKVKVGDTLQLLNLGGVIGASSGNSPVLGSPFDVEILGAILDFGQVGRRLSQARPASITSRCLTAAPMPTATAPVVALLGTSMDSGKTTAASALVSGYTDQGMKVACGKLTGVSLRRDMLTQEDNGAAVSASFTDFGVVTTSKQNAVATAHSLVAYLHDHAPDVTILELGDGIFGPYGVDSLLADTVFRSAVHSFVLCANDPVGAWGAVRYLKESYAISPSLITGPVTDSCVGVEYCKQQLGIAAANAMLDAGSLIDLMPLFACAEQG